MLNCMVYKLNLKLFFKKEQGWTNPDTEVLISRLPPGDSTGALELVTPMGKVSKDR